jgi:hypothetical protein
MKTLTRTALVTPLLLAVVLLSFPLASEAKVQIGAGVKVEKTEKQEKKSDRSGQTCLRGFGHLIAKGFQKNHGPVNLSDYCFLPPGIAKKLGLGGHSTTSTSTIDFRKPVISGLSATTSSSTISVSWQTNENTTSKLYYSLTLAGLDLHATSTHFLENSTLKTSHAFTLENLATSTTYYLVVEAKDSSGNRRLSPVFSTSTRAF